MASHNYWIRSSTLISTFSSFMLLIVSLNDFYNKGRDLTNELKKSTIQDFLSCTLNAVDLLLKILNRGKNCMCCFDLKFQFQFYHHMNILIIAVLSSFEMQNVFVLEDWNLWPFDNRKANLFLRPGKDVTLFYTLILSFQCPEEFCKEPGRKGPLLLCQNMFCCLFQGSTREPHEASLKKSTLLL